MRSGIWPDTCVACYKAWLLYRYISASWRHFKMTLRLKPD